MYKKSIYWVLLLFFVSNCAACMGVGDIKSIPPEVPVNNIKKILMISDLGRAFPLESDRTDFNDRLLSLMRGCGVEASSNAVMPWPFADLDGFAAGADDEIRRQQPDQVLKVEVKKSIVYKQDGYNHGSSIIFRSYMYSPQNQQAVWEAEVSFKTTYSSLPLGHRGIDLADGLFRRMRDDGLFPSCRRPPIGVAEGNDGSAFGTVNCRRCQDLEPSA